VNIIRMHEFHQKAQAAKKASDRAEELAKPEETVSDEEPEPEIPPAEPIPEPEPETPPAEPAPEPAGVAVIETEQDIAPAKKPTRIHTAKALPKTEPPQEPQSDDKTHHLLEEVLHRLKSKDREGLYREFSVFKLLSLMFQVVAVFCLIVSVCLWLSRKAESESVIIMIGYAAAVQLLVIALQMMHSND